MAGIAALLPGTALAAPAQKAAPKKPPARSPAPARPATPPAKPAAPANPAPPAPAAPERLTAQNLPLKLRALGYQPTEVNGVQRLRFEEEAYSYQVDVRVTPSGDWLFCAAALAPIPDLTKVPSGPLLALLGLNDKLLGLYFSYERSSGQIRLNAAVPVAGFDPADLKAVLEGLRSTVRQTEGLWDPSLW